MNNKPHTAEAKRNISESMRRYWATQTDEQRQARKQKIKDFYKTINSKAEEEQAKEWERLHRIYIKEEYTKLFGKS